MDRLAWRTTVHGVAKSQTRQSDEQTLSSFPVWLSQVPVKHGDRGVPDGVYGPLSWW